MELVLKKNKPLLVKYQDLKNRKPLKFIINGKEISNENTRRFAWKRLIEGTALHYWTTKEKPSIVSVEDVYPNGLQSDRVFANAIAFYHSSEEVEIERKARNASQKTSINAIEKDGEKVYYGSFSGIDAVMLSQGLLNKYGADEDEVRIEYSATTKNINAIHDKDDANRDEPAEIQFLESNNIGLNTILYGPPGTGKTYRINEYKKNLLSEQIVIDQQYNFEGLSWKDAIYLAYNEKKFKSLSIKSIEKTDVIRSYSKTKKISQSTER